MIVLTCLPPGRLARLRAALEDAAEVRTAADWEDAQGQIRREPIDVLVADPAFAPGTPDAAAILALRIRFRALPFVIYTALRADTAAPLAALGRAGCEEVVLEGLDDDPWRLRAVLVHQPGVALAERLVTRIGPALREAPPEVARAVERVIHTPSAFRGVPDLAAAASVSRRTIYREFDRAHLASPREVIAASRVLRAYALLREGARSIEEVAAALRYSNTHHLTRAMRWACGLTTARAREHIEPDVLVERLAARICPALRSSTSGVS